LQVLHAPFDTEITAMRQRLFKVTCIISKRFHHVKKCQVPITANSIIELLLGPAAGGRDQMSYTTEWIYLEILESDIC
jgi:hypothetical protein